MSEQVVVQEQSALAVTQQGAFVVSPRHALGQLHELQAVVKEVMKEGEHYGIIPGTNKPTLLKPGAELLCNMYGYAAQDVEVVAQEEQWTVMPDQATGAFPLFRYLLRVRLVNNAGRVVAVGVGECNSYETRYRWRESRRKCPVCGKETIIKGKAEYGGGWLCFEKRGGCKQKFKEGDPQIEKQTVGRALNDAIHDQVNTILKMAKKRAYIDATLSATRTSGMFTQDMEDFAGLADIPDAGKEAKAVEAAPKPDDSKVPQEYIVPAGLHKGKDMRDLSEKQLAGLIGFLAASDAWAVQLANAKKLHGDVFGGALDNDVPQEPAPDASAPMEQDAAQGDVSTLDELTEQHAKLIAEVRQTYEQIFPTFNDKKPQLSKEDVALAGQLAKKGFGVDSWTALMKLSVAELRAGIPRFVTAVEHVYNERATSKAPKKKGGKK